MTFRAPEVSRTEWGAMVARLQRPLAQAPA